MSEAHAQAEENTEGEEGEQDNNLPLIVGCVAGGIILILVIVIIVIWYRQRTNGQRQSDSHVDSSTRTEAQNREAVARAAHHNTRVVQNVRNQNVSVTYDSGVYIEADANLNDDEAARYDYIRYSGLEDENKYEELKPEGIDRDVATYAGLTN